MAIYSPSSGNVTLDLMDAAGAFDDVEVFTLSNMESGENYPLDGVTINDREESILLAAPGAYSEIPPEDLVEIAFKQHLSIDFDDIADYTLYALIDPQHDAFEYPITAFGVEDGDTVILGF